MPRAKILVWKTKASAPSARRLPRDARLRVCTPPSRLRKGSRSPRRPPQPRAHGLNLRRAGRHRRRAGDPRTLRHPVDLLSGYPRSEEMLAMRRAALPRQAVLSSSSRRRSPRVKPGWREAEVVDESTSAGIEEAHRCLARRGILEVTPSSSSRSNPEGRIDTRTPASSPHGRALADFAVSTGSRRSSPSADASARAALSDLARDVPVREHVNPIVTSSAQSG